MRLALAVALLGLNTSGARGQEAADAARLYRTHCASCHAVRPGQVAVMHGPNLAGVYGRAAGSLPGYPYSPALAGASFVWDEAKLEAWVADPESVLPGTMMRSHLPDPVVRQRIIDWLKQPS